MSQTKAQLIDPVDGTIVNADINASAAIAGSKISTNFGTQDLLINGKISLDASKEIGVFEADTSLGFTNSAKLSFDFSSNLARIRSSGNGSFSARPLTFNIVNTEAMRIDSSGRLLIGTTSARSSGGSVNAHLQLEGTNSQSAEFLITRNSADTFSPVLGLVKTRGTSVGSNTTVADNDVLGTIQFRGADGSDIFSVGASIFARVNGSPSDGTDMPGELVFATSADGASSPTERMSIDSSGKVGISTTSPRSRLDLGTGTDASTVSNTAADYQLGLHAAQSTTNDIGRNIAFISQTVGTVTAAINSVDLGGGDATGLTFLTGNSTSIDERVRIKNTGYVGIGSTGDSTYKTHIKSSTFGLLKLETTLTGADGAYLELKHTSTSPADNDQLGIIQFKGKNSNDDDNTYGYLMFRSLDVTDGTEDGELQVVTQNAGTAATRLTVGQDGAIKANTGNFVVGTSGRGIQFDTADSGSDQLLDDYEEGVFSFTKRGFASGFDANYALGNQTGKYTKIGRLVTLKGGFNLTGSSGNIAATNYFTLNMSSLPFAMDDTSSGYTGAIVSHQGAWWAYTSLGGGSNAKGAVIAVYNDYLSFYVTSVTGSPSRNSNEITFTITYTSS